MIKRYLKDYLEIRIDSILNDIQKMAPVEKGHVLFALDALIQKIKIKNIAAL